MSYIENPKTKGSGIVCCIPQRGRCPNECEDCFFISGRSYLEPLDENTPNMPTLEEVGNRIVRVNDGNDSNNDLSLVIKMTEEYPLKFYNTINMDMLAQVHSPTVLTVNPGNMTDTAWQAVPKPITNILMYVRIRTNTWNVSLVREAVRYYTTLGVPCVLNFMAYWKNTVHIGCQHTYQYRRRTLNKYWAIEFIPWRNIMDIFAKNPLVYSCGREGRGQPTGCKYCGNCLREFYNTKERMRVGGRRNDI